MSINSLPIALSLATLALSCNVQTAAETTETSADRPEPVPAVAAAVPRAKLDRRSAEIESSGAPVSSESVARANAAAERLGSAIAHAEGSRIAFVSCEQALCSARLSATSLISLQQALQGVDQDQAGRISFSARERLDPYQGRSFEADVTLGTATENSSAVPNDAAELLLSD